MWALDDLLFLKLSSSSENGDVLVRASVDLKRHHDRDKGRHLTGLTVSDFLFIVIMVGYGSVEADMELEEELRVLDLDPRVTGSELCH